MRFLPLVALLAACGSNNVGVSALGSGAHDASLLRLTTLATADDGLATPTDVSINPNQPGTLWVTNYAENRITVYDGSSWSIHDGAGSNHFLASPMALSFSDNGEFATAHDTDDLTQGNATPADFMGPTLWDDSSNFNGGHAGHLDMLHNTPLGGGVAWETERVYWLFDGYHSSLTRYNFNEDHGYGGSDHTDGEIDRYVEGEVSRIEGIPSHLDFDAASGLLFAADTANGRIAVLDTTTGERGGTIGPNYDGGRMNEVEGAEIFTLADGGNLEIALDDNGNEMSDPTTLEQPAGLELDGDILYVTDHATSRILALDAIDGTLMDWVELDYPAGTLGGIEVDADGSLLVTLMNENTLVRITTEEAQ